MTAVYDRVKTESSSTGTGTLTLSSASAQFRAFADVFSDTDTTYYTIMSGDSSSWETGVGTVGNSGSELARTTVLSNSAGTTAKISLTGTSTVFCSYPAAEAIHGIGSGGKMVQTSAETWSTGALSVISFDTASSFPGKAATGSAIELDTTNNKIILKKKGWYQLTGMVSAADDDAMGNGKMWICLGTGTTLSDQFTVSLHEDTSSDVVYGVITAAYYCATPNDDIYFTIYPSTGGGSSSYTASVSTDRYKPKFSAVYVR